MTTALVRRQILDLDQFASACGLHPEVVRRFVALGLIEPVLDARGEPGFPITQVAMVARVQRLRSGFALNYATVGLVCDLLDRIDELERTIRQGASPVTDR